MGANHNIEVEFRKGFFDFKKSRLGARELIMNHVNQTVFFDDGSEIISTEKVYLPTWKNFAKPSERWYTE